MMPIYSHRLAHLSMPGALFAADNDDELESETEFLPLKTLQEGEAEALLRIVQSQSRLLHHTRGVALATTEDTQGQGSNDPRDCSKRDSRASSAHSVALTSSRDQAAAKRPSACILATRQKVRSAPLFLQKEGSHLLVPPHTIMLHPTSSTASPAPASGNRGGNTTTTSSSGDNINSGGGVTGSFMKYLSGGRQRTRASSSSVSSIRSSTDGQAGPSSQNGSGKGIESASVAALADEREANLRTPRPHVTQTTPSPGDTTPLGNETRVPFSSHTASHLNAPIAQESSSTRWRILQWQRERSASEQETPPPPPALSLDTNAPDSTAPSRTGSMIDTMSYPSDSLGRNSVTSSAFDASASEFGTQSRLSASESGHGSIANPRLPASGSAKKKSRAVAPPEKLVVVRPPPSKQTNPLNLQIQLVTPQPTANNGNRVSGELSRETDASGTGSTQSSGFGAGLAAGLSLNRRASTMSTRSGSSDASSMGQSSLSAGSTSRRVTPLYNLAFHSIMPTTVTDAGTDQKVAKFSKRGIEIDGFGLIVPHEIAHADDGNAVRPTLVEATVARDHPDGAARSIGSSGIGNGSDPNSPEGHSELSHTRSTESFAAQLPQGSDSGHEPSSRKITEPPTSFDAMSPEAKEPGEGGPGIGGRLIRGLKRLNVNAPPNLQGTSKGAPSMRSGVTDISQAPSIFSKMSGAAAKMRDGDSALFGHRPTATDDADSTMIGQGASSSVEVPQLIVGAGIRSDGSRRASGYVWTVRRWARRNDGSHDDFSAEATPGRQHSGANPTLNSVWKRFSTVNRMGGFEAHPPAREIEVRFEWTRQPCRKRSTAGSSVARHSRVETDGTSRSRSKPRQLSSEAGGAAPRPDSLLPPGQRSRPSSVYSNSGGARSGSLRGSLDHCSVAGSVLSGEDGGVESDPEDNETMWSCHLVLGPTTRIPIGSMCPTPHHPKLVAQLTIPYPLPDLSQSALGADGAGLTREELKDIISVTCLFVIIREAFGGLAKRRKGDSALRFGAATAQR